MSIKLIGVVPTKQAQYNEQGNEISPAEYNDSSYYVISHRAIVGLTSVTPDRPFPRFGSTTVYYAFADEAEAKQQLNYDEESEQFNVEYHPTVEQFKSNRQQQLDNAVVTTSTGKQFDADEMSIIRLGNALVAADGEPDTTIIQWSLANDGTGVMTDCTKAEIKEAHRLAMENMSNIWSVE